MPVVIRHIDATAREATRRSLPPFRTGGASSPAVAGTGHAQLHRRGAGGAGNRLDDVRRDRQRKRQYAQVSPDYNFWLCERDGDQDYRLSGPRKGQARSDERRIRNL